MKLIASFLIAAALVAPVLSHANEPAAKAAKPDLAKGEATFNAVCAACHGAGGNSAAPVNPKLAQQHPDYIVKQLQEFKSGKRANPVMSGMVAALSEEDMRNVAAFYASKQAKPGFAKNKELVLLGEKIYRGGIADKQVPACAGCHSPNGAGIGVELAANPSHLETVDPVVLGMVRAKFIRLSIDDTGVGYSSLKRIISLKPDMVKLERALVSNIDGDRIKQALIRALQEFAAEIGVRVVAEGVERAAERDALLNLGVTLGQGYLFGGAVSAASLREAIDRQ